MNSDNHPTRDRKNYSSETIKKPRIKICYGSSQGHFFILGFALFQNCYFLFFSLHAIWTQCVQSFVRASCDLHPHVE